MNRPLDPTGSRGQYAPFFLRITAICQLTKLKLYVIKSLFLVGLVGSGHIICSSLLLINGSKYKILIYLPDALGLYLKEKTPLGPGDPGLFSLKKTKMSSFCKRKRAPKIKTRYLATGYMTIIHILILVFFNF